MFGVVYDAPHGMQLHFHSVCLSDYFFFAIFIQAILVLFLIILDFRIHLATASLHIVTSLPEGSSLPSSPSQSLP